MKRFEGISESLAPASTRPPSLSKIFFARQQHGQANPLGTAKFPEEWWLDLEVEQNGELIRLCTYRHQPPKPKAILAMFHGFCCHINHGAHIA